MLQGAKKDTPARAEDTTTHRGLIAFSRAGRATKALLRWTNGLDAGVCKDVSEYAKEVGLTKRQLLKELRDNEQLQKELFGPSMMEARMGLAKSIAVAYDQIGDANVMPADQRGWADFLAKLINGYYEKGKNGQQANVLINLVPALAETQQHIAHRIVDVENLSDLGA